MRRIRAIVHRAGRQAGFTLSEMLVALGLIGAMFAMFATVVGSTIRHDGEVREQTTLQAEVRAAIDMLAGELRQANTADEAVAPIESMSATQITFLSPDRAEPYHMRRISWRLSGGRLERSSATSTDTDGPPWLIPTLGGWAPRADSITSTALFVYRDSTGAITSTAADVSTIEVAVTVATKTSPDRTYSYKTSVTLRTPYEI